jgi:hypothetical protein
MNYSFLRKLNWQVIFYNTIIFSLNLSVVENHLYYLAAVIVRILVMNDFQRDILIGLMFVAGIFGFISGEFIISTLLFASAAIFTNLAINRQRGHEMQ